MDPKTRDMAEFKRLRRYYRDNFQNGASHESFILWCEQMCIKMDLQADALKYPSLES
jgi:hypothetical protein